MAINTIRAQRKCPICDESRVQILYTFSMFLPEAIPLAGDYAVVSCSKCGFVYQDSRATLLDYENYYTYFNKYGAAPTITEETLELFGHYKGIFDAVVKKDARILDVGCAGGILLDFLKESGYNKVAGLDPSEDCVKKMSDRGIESYLGSIYSVNPAIPGKSFDLIILSGVMEHLFDVQKAVQTLDRYLEDSGKIFIGVPDAARYGDYFNSFSYYFNFEHINHFSNTSLNNLMLKFKYVNVRTDYHDISFGDSIVPVFSAVYQKNGVRPASFTKDMLSFQSASHYFQFYTYKLEDIVNRVNELLGTQEEIVIWGAGNVSIELLSRTNLRKCNIQAFVDKDPGKQGKTLAGKKICPPEILRSFNGTIVICAAVYAADILSEIKSMGLKNKTLVLK